jgi:hypothetical protein
MEGHVPVWFFISSAIKVLLRVTALWVPEMMQNWMASLDTSLATRIWKTVE